MKLLQHLLYELSMAVMHAAHWCRFWLRRISGDTRVVHGVRVLVDNGHGEVLLLRHWYAPGVWTLPGGGINQGETLEEAALRELHEETGYVARGIGGKIGIYQGSRPDDQVAAVFVTTYGGSLQLFPNIEVMERGFFSMNALPKNISPANRRRIEEYLSGVRNSLDTRW